MTDDDFAMLRACLQGGLFCLGVGGLWVIVSVVREWWRGRDREIRREREKMTERRIK